MLKRPLKLAEWTGLEPATPGVTGRYSNQLNYHSSFTTPILKLKSANFLALFLNQFEADMSVRFMVGANGVEPLTFAL